MEIEEDRKDHLDPFEDFRRKREEQGQSKEEAPKLEGVRDTSPGRPKGFVSHRQDFGRTERSLNIPPPPRPKGYSTHRQAPPESEDSTAPDSDLPPPPRGFHRERRLPE